MNRMLSLRLLLSAASLLVASAAWAIDYQDHYEFDGTMVAPFKADAAGHRRVDLQFRFPGADHGTLIAWRLELLSPRGKVVRTWTDETRIEGGSARGMVSWYERDAVTGPLPDGIYTLRLSATPLDATKVGALAVATVEQRVNRMLELAGPELEPQTAPIRIGNPVSPSIVPMARLPVAAIHAPSTTSTNASTLARPSTSASQSAVAPQSVPATGGSGYTVYYGNLHSQTNHSDGGGAVSTCTDAQNPQAGAYGPSDAYPYAMNEGLDFLMTSEHNHLFDGSTGTNTSASPTTAHNLYQSGLSAASSFNSAHPNFLAIYGMEWGVISNGGHLNIFNSPQLLEWEYNSSNQLIGDVYSPKGDYGALYTQMKSNGWIGQFNHPASSGQFTINGTDLAYTADGDSVMVACEVTNTSAFSNNTTETETSRSSYETACNKLLEAGYHVAFTTDQDNHCANWGASYPNRTGVLIPTGTALSSSSFLAALQARHVFATLDKTAQLTLTASGGHLMGDRFNNTGALTLTVNYAPGTGRSASQIQVYQGVPGSNGTVSVLSTTASTTTTPAAGNHFYYAKVTQDDGTTLWSAPLWVTEGTGTGDTTAPTVSASESGSSGTITLSATASDNVGVTKVEFYVDGTLKATDTSSPYSSTLDSTTLSNGSHSLTAKAYDAAGNVGTSSAVSFTVSNTSSDTTAPTVSASESGSSGTITLSATASDNVGVSKVEFYVDGTLKATDTNSPYSSTLDSTTLSNGSHSLTAKAYDAAGNLGTSAAVSFTVSNTSGTPVEQVSNGGFESGSTGWTASSGVITNDTSEAAHAGSYKAWLDGYGAATTDTVYQAITIPSAATSATFSFWLHIDTAETTTTKVYDTLTVQVRSSSGSVLATLATYSNLNAASGYTQKSFSLASYKGQTVQLFFSGVEDAQDQTSFVIDDVSLKTQ